MATHKLGKLKFNLSKQGLAYKWGDGEVRRFNFGKKAPSTENDYDNYEEYAEDGYSDVGFDDADAQAYDEGAYEDGYDGEYDQDMDGMDDEGYAGAYAGDYAGDGEYDEAAYEDDGYGDENYAEDGYEGEYEEYDDQPYDEAGYDDGYAETGYDDGYDDYDERAYDEDYEAYGEEGYDEGYDEEYDGYDDPYSDADANEAYADEYYGEEENSILQYVDENSWVIYLLLFLLPPLGIYLLWRSNRFEALIRYILTAASAIWFIIALILIFTGIFGGQDDKTKDNYIVPSISPTISVTPTPTPTAEPADPVTEVSPSPTPLGGTNAGTNNGSTGSDEYVYSPASGLYYHSSNTCANIGAGVSTSRVPVEIAQSSRNQAACPLCYTGKSGTSGSGLYYATRGGTYYHSDETCSDMKNASTYTKEAAEKAGKKACPVCVTKLQKTLDTNDVKIITSSTTDKSNISVYATKGGTYYHMTSDCSGMKGASKGSLKAALLAGKLACPTCCKVASTSVYCTAGGTYYHLDDDCSGMKNALNVTLAEAMVLGKQRCKDCIKKSLTSGTSVSGGSSSSSAVYVYGTKNGKYYHTDEDCSGMKNAQKYTLKSMIAAGRDACPECAGSANTQVYAKKGGTYYHSYATCSGMENATVGSMAEALAYGFKRCPKCWSSGSSSTTTSAGINTGSSTKVYATEGGTYYHTNDDCSGMKNASAITLSAAVDNGKSACPTCASTAKRTVYSTDKGTYYHTDQDCSGMQNAKKRTLQAALLKDQKACPECIGKASASSDKTSSGSGSSGTYKSGTSGIKVYATQEGTYYHTDEDCSGMKNASKITLETALNYGKKACTDCASTAARTVYATKSGKYYHTSKSCAGSGAKSGTVGEAVAYGYDPCPYCVSKSSSSGSGSSGTYKSGTSGVKVYATINGKYFHREADCSGMENASLVTLETAMNYGKSGCPECFSSANKTVYAKSGSKYYHYTKSCAGSGALAGSLAKARALGMSPCSKCTSSGSSSGSSSSDSGSISSTGKKYSATAGTAVYIDLDGDNYYYHKAKKCSTTGTSGATKVTLQYVKDVGYKACPYCEPPTSISNA